jgi:hypothetical protein
MKKNFLRNSQTPTLKKFSNKVHIPGFIDQDLDSLKLSIQADVTQGYKNTLRFKSNYYQNFFDKVEGPGFKRLTTEITSLYKLPKVLRTLKVDSKSRIKNKSLNLEREKNDEIVRPNELSFLMELKKSPRSVLPKIKKFKAGVLNEFEVFEERLRDFSLRKKINTIKLYNTSIKYEAVEKDTKDE